MKTILSSVVAIVLGGGFCGEESSLISKLVAESRSGRSLMESEVLPDVRLDPSDARAAGSYIRSHQDYTAYHLSFALRRKARQIYDLIPQVDRARVLCSALVHLNYLNDWGYLEPNEPYDGEAAKALIEIGPVALDCMKPILEDERPAPLLGTEEATLSSTYHYRRRDFAYRYVLLILGKPYRFHPDPAKRDRDIEQLKTELKP